MSAEPLSIDRLRIASPCPVGWDQMAGDNRVRFCDQCQLNVYNIAELSRTEVKELIASSEGRICARLFRRADGTVLIKDCPVGLRALRLRVSKRVAAVFAAIASISSLGSAQQSNKVEKTSCTPQTRITRTDSSTSAISGTTLDPAGAIIAGAEITLTNLETLERKTTTSKDKGQFEFPALTPGSYSLEAVAPYFRTHKVLNVVVDEKKLNKVDLTLELADDVLTGVVDVTQVFETKPGTTIISEQMIRRLPIQ